jgi:hypothetical protein
MASLGHVLAAKFCPRVLGRECCFAKTTNHTHGSPSNHENMVMHDMHMDCMLMDGMNIDDMAMGEKSMGHTDAVIEVPNFDISIPSSAPAFNEEAEANKFDQPVESCAHCLGDSGIVNVSLSFVSITDQSGKDTMSVLLPAPRFPVRTATAPPQIGLPSEHAPPGKSAPRYILISVFLI